MSVLLVHIQHMSPRQGWTGVRSTPVCGQRCSKSAKCGASDARSNTSRESDTLIYVWDGLGFPFRLAVSGLLLYRSSHYTAPMIPHNIHLYKISTPCQPVRDFPIMLFTTSLVATVEYTLSLLPMIFETTLLYN